MTQATSGKQEVMEYSDTILGHTHLHQMRSWNDIL